MVSTRLLCASKQIIIRPSDQHSYHDQCLLADRRRSEGMVHPSLGGSAPPLTCGYSLALRFAGFLGDQDREAGRERNLAT
jgi:hypothetical protein